MSTRILGIDFGTSRTVFSMTSTKARSEPEIVVIDKKPFVETIMRLDDSGSIELFGTEAWEKIDEAPERTFYEFKMGISKVGTSEQDQPATTEVAETRFTPQQLGLMFLRRAREKIEKLVFNESSLADEVIITVIGYPAEWNEKQRMTTIDMAQEAGFPNVHGCEEPLGVIYYHDYKGDLSVDHEQTILVYDFGGGTSDVVVVKTVANEKPQVLGIGGALNLGGRDFDKAIYNILLVQCGLSPQSMDPRDVVTIRRAGRTLKEKLAVAYHDGRNNVESTVYLYGTRAQKRLHLDLPTFEKCCEPLIHRFSEPVNDALNRADTAREAINLSILAGGSARMHYVRKALDELFPNDVSFQSPDPSEVVAKGLAIYGRFFQGEKVVDSLQSSTLGGSKSSTNPEFPRHVRSDNSHISSRLSSFWGQLATRGKIGICIGILSLAFLFMLAIGGSNSIKSGNLVEEIRRYAELGDAEAQFEIAERYFYGKGIQQDILEAYKWYYISSRLGYSNSEKKIRDLRKRRWLLFSSEISQDDANRIEKEADRLIQRNRW
ncbi:Hsp70 family protein [Desulfonatronum lacustre]|uniref:Hsp70 family protein n=1 Tax=Desulfonatronum lacustre TaxID=66849 RepID=UPI00048D1C43|nr:Hsp70 family protein [Desulfonatronum lacustre]